MIVIMIANVSAIIVSFVDRSSLFFTTLTLKIIFDKLYQKAKSDNPAKIT